MKHVLLILVILFSVFSCNSNKNKASIYDYIPENAEVILNINAIDNLKSNLTNNSFISDLGSTLLLKEITNKINFLDYIKTPEPLVLAFYNDTLNTIQFTCATKQTPNMFGLDSLKNINIDSFTYNNYPVKKISFTNDTIYTTYRNSIVLIASNETLLKKVLSKKNKTKALNTPFNFIDKTKPLSVIINSKSSSDAKSLFYSEALPLNQFTNITGFDADIYQDEIILSGVTQAKDSSRSLITAFKNTVPQENQLAKIAPNNCDGFLSFTFNDFSVFNKQLKAFRKDTLKTQTNALFKNVIEVGLIHLTKNKAIVLHSLDIIETKEALIAEQTLAEKYRQINIYNFSKPGLFAKVFNPLINFKTINYYAILDAFIVFGSTKEDLENIIANYQNETTLSSRKYYTAISQNLSTEASILQVLKPKILKTILEKNLNTNLKTSFNDYKISALQFIFDTNYAHFNAIIKKNKTEAESNTVTEILNIKLNANLLNDPQFVINHRTKNKDIVVQDINNNLYLISNSGKILWKKKLNGPVLGKIEQLDIYKNGRLQLVFATPNRVYLIDRNGNNVSGYPLKFNDKITQPLSVFDYDKNKNYRLFVTQGKNILLYNAKGKTVKGFNFNSTKQTINTQPQHIRIGDKDYIILKTDKTLHILSRRGKTRVQPKVKLEYSSQPVFMYGKEFATTLKNGDLITISQNGTPTSSLLLGENANLVTTSKTLVAQIDNKLKIKNKLIELDFGNYTAPKLFYLNNKIYVSLTDLQSQKVLLFNSQAKPIENFPVYGNSAIALDNIDNDKALEFVTKGEENTLLVYKIN